MSQAPTSFARALRLTSLPRYIWWRLRKRRTPVALRLRDGPRILLRPASVGNNDYGVAYEIFVHRFYDCPRPIDTGQVRLVVDLGANVGFSCLHWLSLFPNAALIAVEPHPRHFAQCRANLALNGMLPRVTLYEAAAGVAADRLSLVDAGTSSAITAASAAGIPVEVIDVFPLLQGRQIDVLKIDIEGGEYPILDDPRFSALRVARLVMEWHGQGGRSRCAARLEAAGYQIQDLFDAGSHGMLWAFGPA